MSRRRSTESDRLFAMPLVAHIALVLVMAVVLAGVLGFALWWGIGQPSIITGEPWTAKDSFDLVKIVLTIVGGIGAVVALVVSYRKQRLGEAAERREDSRLFGEDFARATEQLGSAEAPVRLAGMYTLERLGQNTPQQQQTIVNVLCAYLRMPYTPPDSDPTEERRQEDERRRQEREVRRTAQRILATNLRPSKDSENQHWRDIRLDLTGATLLDFNLHECQLESVRFTGARFSGYAHFDGARFSAAARFDGARFSGDARFDGVRFGEVARFDGAQFSGNARFDEVRFSEYAWFNGAQFCGNARFDEVRFDEYAWFNEAQFGKFAEFGEVQFGRPAFFSGAQFSGDARFDRAQFSGDAWFDEARFSDYAYFNDVQLGGDSWFNEARFIRDSWFSGARFSAATGFGGVRFSAHAGLDEARVRLDVSENVLSARTWPQGYAVTAPTTTEEAHLPDCDGQWGYLVRVESAENDTHSVTTGDTPEPP